MGNPGIKRRKPRPRPRPDPDAGGWEMQHSPYTFEGQIEGLRRFGRGVSSASPSMRLLATVVALLFILPFVAGLVTWLLD